MQHEDQNTDKLKMGILLLSGKRVENEFTGEQEMKFYYQVEGIYANFQEGFTSVHFAQDNQKPILTR